jgi:hypothetical protein
MVEIFRRARKLVEADTAPQARMKVARHAAKQVPGKAT